MSRFDDWLNAPEQDSIRQLPESTLYFLKQHLRQAFAGGLAAGEASKRGKPKGGTGAG